MYRQSGRIKTLGKGAVHSSSLFNHLITRSLTKTELAVVDEFIPRTLCARYVLEEQGYNTHRKIM